MNYPPNEKNIEPHNKRGQAHGYWKVYHRDSGKLMYEGLYVNGQMDALQKDYNKKGQLIEIGKYNHGKPYGMHKGYRDNGVLSRKEYYI